MPTTITMTEAMKAFGKNLPASRLTKDKAFRISITRQTERQSEGAYLVQFFRMPRKTAPKEEQVEEEELTLRFDTLQRALNVSNQALAGGLETLLMFNKPPSDRNS